MLPFRCSVWSLSVSSSVRAGQTPLVKMCWQRNIYGPLVKTSTTRTYVLNTAMTTTTKFEHKQDCVSVYWADKRREGLGLYPQQQLMYSCMLRIALKSLAKSHSGRILYFIHRKLKKRITFCTFVHISWSCLSWLISSQASVVLW